MKFWLSALIILSAFTFGCSSANSGARSTSQPASIAVNTKPVSNTNNMSVKLATPEFINSHTESASALALDLVNGADDQFPKKELIKSAFTTTPAFIRTQLPKLAGKTVHIILQDHGVPNNQNVVPETSTISSQQKVAQVLDSLKPKVLALEGFSLDKISTKEHLIIEMSQMMSKEEKKSPQYRQQIEEAYVHTLNRQAGARYALQNIGCDTFGGELLGVNVITYLAADDSAPPEAKALYDKLQPVRSWIMLSRLSERMVKSQSDSGTLIIGSMHQQEIADAAKAFDFKVVFHQTT